MRFNLHLGSSDSTLGSSSVLNFRSHEQHIFCGHFVHAITQAWVHGDFSHFQDLHQTCRHPRPLKANKEHIMRVHIHYIPCVTCGLAFGQNSQLKEHQKKKLPCQRPLTKFPVVSQETRKMAANMKECDGSDEGRMYTIMFAQPISEPGIFLLFSQVSPLTPSSCQSALPCSS